MPQNVFTNGMYRLVVGMAIVALEEVINIP